MACDVTRYRRYRIHPRRIRVHVGTARTPIHDWLALTIVRACFRRDGGCKHRDHITSAGTRTGRSAGHRGLARQGHPWAPPTTVRAPTSPYSAKWPSRSSCASSTRDGTERRVTLPGWTASSGTLPAVSSRASAMATRISRPARPGQRVALQSQQAAARPVLEGHRRRLRLEPVAVRLNRRPDSRNDDDSAAGMPKSVVISPRSSTGGVDRRRNAEYADSIIYEAHVKGTDRDASRHPRPAPRYLCGHRIRRSSST